MDELDKPTPEQTAWVLRHMADLCLEGGSFRHFVYDRMGYGPDTYPLLKRAGGMLITNTISRANRGDRHEEDLARALGDMLQLFRREEEFMISEERFEAWEQALANYEGELQV